MKKNTILNLIERESLKLLTECEKNERYINESIAQLEQQERLYTERVEEVQRELKEERTKLAVLKIQKYGASKALEGKQYDNSIVSNVIRKYDKVRVILNLPDGGHVDADRERYVGAVGNVVGIDEDYEYPYNIEFEGENLGQDWLWKKEEVDKNTEIWLLEAEIRVISNNKRVTLDFNDGFCKTHQGYPYMTLDQIFKRVRDMRIYPYITVEVKSGNYGTIFQTGNYRESIGKWIVHGITTGEC